jgi:hypothetical protein
MATDDRAKRPADPVSIPEALVCQTQVVNEQGEGTVWFVRLPDGFLLNCGCGWKCDERAKDVAERLNSTYARSV